MSAPVAETVDAMAFPTKLKWALRYAAWGWAVLRVRLGTKKVVGSWGQYQKRRPTDAKLRKWFGDGSDHELAILCGHVSSGLAVRDFDTPESYEAWKAEHPDEARRLPTVKTARGFHVYATCPDTKSRPLGDGELRAEGNYVLCPPSVHPDGHEYHWIIPPDGPPPAVDPVRVFGAPKQRQGAPPFPSNGLCVLSDPEFSVFSGASMSSMSSVSDDCRVAIERAIRMSLPPASRKRNRGVFTLCRALKAIPEVAEWEVGQFVPIVRKWYGLALQNIATKDFGITLADFNNGWPNVKVPLGVDRMQEAFKRARVAPVPECVKGMGEKIELLARASIELEALNDDGVFALACRKAGELLGMGRSEANKLLHLMVDLKLWEIVKPGTPGENGDAAEYRIIWRKEFEHVRV